MRKVKVGLIGCGNISSIYIKNCKELYENIEIAACADIFPERAAERALEFNIPNVYTVEELLSDKNIEIVLNLTVPNAHAEVTLKALEAGKHVYVEKPLATRRDDGKKILELAKTKGLLVGCAPDTFLGGGLQTGRKLIDDGWIGKPIAATAFMMGHNPEAWHPDPEFLYKPGAGPLFDMGPYYLTTLVSILGPIHRVCSSAKITHATRTITSKPKYGETIIVEVPTFITSILDFKSGATGTLITSFDTCGSRLPSIEIYGTAGSISLPDPNTFSGPVSLKREGQAEWKEIPLGYGYTENSRGLGLSDMANALLHGGTHRANAEMAMHVLDVMQGIHEASESGKYFIPESSCNIPEPMKMNY